MFQGAVHFFKARGYAWAEAIRGRRLWPPPIITNKKLKINQEITSREALVVKGKRHLLVLLLDKIAVVGYAELLSLC